ncbi:hypothetical protein LTSEUGA_1056 [Salmonella enterica subsp. enterica serovar Uganda str. R8-3404]|uniref:Uncharacterized protein n=1 Tax=Salmonella enterica subsp. enterica serovar Uganda str. R8-3404 TaxID=913083 RepID=A0A6C8H7P0_SALET|nr:hypothetical protein LTSEUGA_1056 [Salmonella enterica subsp. enterica serovar Uganda str. R8-3404]
MADRIKRNLDIQGDRIKRNLDMDIQGSCSIRPDFLNHKISFPC